ncbi:MAG TPA: YHS domain-containing protein [bacterium]
MRTKLFFGVLIVLFSVALVSSFSYAQKDDTKKAETITCLVTGETVLKSEAAGPFKYNEKEYYFCCNGCQEKFTKDPETYLNKTKDMMCGMDIDKRTALKSTFEGKDFYFCNEKCKEAFEKDPKAHAMKSMKTSKVHAHDEKCEGCDQCTEGKAEKMDKKGCCGDKAKVEKSAKTKI